MTWRPKDWNVTPLVRKSTPSPFLTFHDKMVHAPARGANVVLGLAVDSCEKASIDRRGTIVRVRNELRMARWRVSKFLYGTLLATWRTVWPSLVPLYNRRSTTVDPVVASLIDDGPLESTQVALNLGPHYTSSR